MALVVMHECAEVGVGIADVDSGRIGTLDVDGRGSAGSGDNRRRRSADLYGWCAAQKSLKLGLCDAGSLKA